MIIFSLDKRYLNTDIKYKYGQAHFIDQRSLAVLLKSQGLSSPQIALKVDLCQQPINKWV